MARNAVIDDATGAVKRWGECDFTAELVAGESQVSLDADVFPAAGVKRRHHKVVDGAFVEMTQGEKDAADASPVVGLTFIPSGSELRVFDSKQVIAAVGPGNWDVLGEVTLDLAAVGQLSALLAIVTSDFKTDAAGAKLRLVADSGEGTESVKGTMDLPSTAGVWKRDQSVMVTAPGVFTAGRQRYTLEGQLNAPAILAELRGGMWSPFLVKERFA